MRRIRSESIREIRAIRGLIFPVVVKPRDEPRDEFE
jgi:hypothetical protein